MSEREGGTASETSDPGLDQRGVHNSRRPSPYYRRGGADSRSNYRRQDPDRRSNLRRRRSPSPNRQHDLELLDTPEKIDDALNELRHLKSEIAEQRALAENSPILADLFAKISQMERRMSETNDGGRKNALKKSPLAPEVEHAPMQHEIQPFQTLIYDGKSDPESHLNRFGTYMSGMGASDATRCKLFPLTLGDLAYRWYVSLPPLSIHCFDELAQHFMSYYACKVTRLEKSLTLIGICQELGESDESYVDRVGELLLIGEEVGDDLKLHVAMSGLSRDTELFKYLMLNYPKNYEDFRVKAGQEIWLQKLTRKEEDTRDQRKKAKKMGNFRSFPDPTEIEVNLIEQTGHNPANIMQILQVSGSGLLVKPGPLRAPANKLDVRKWCAFHEAHGHLTRECRDLLRQLWKLFEDGKLWDFIVRPGQKGGDLGKESNVPLQGKTDFQVISKSAIITFTPEDREGVSYPKGDALVVSATILGMVVARVLVDNAAFCNLIFKSALDQMGNLVEYIRPFDRKLKGLGDAEVHPYGVITLPLEIVDYKNKEIKMIRSVDFVIVDDRQSAYNACLGRPFLEAFEAVASTHYFCVKFPTPCGVVGTVKGDQVMAEKCLALLRETK